MNAPFQHPQASTRAAESHFALLVYAAFLRLMPLAARHCGGLEPALERWPFLDGYMGELAERGLEGVSLAEARALWAVRIAEFEAAAPALPLAALAEAYGLEPEDLVLLAAAAWADTEPRLGPVLEALHGVAGEGRFTTALLAQFDASGEARLRALLDAGLAETLQPQSPFGLRAVAVPEALAAALLGRGPAGHRPADSLPSLDDLILTKDALEALAGAADLFADGRLDLLTIRGPAHNGRRTLARAVARRLGLGTLEGRLTGGAPDADLAAAAPLAAALGALRILAAEPGVGQTLAAPEAIWRRGPLVVVLPPHGGIDAPADLRRLDLDHPPPDRAQRAALWARGLAGRTDLDPADLAGRWRMNSGSIDRAARSAEVSAAAARRATIGLSDLAAARRMLGRESLDSLATPVPPAAGWSQLVAPETTRAELAMLEARCRHREAMAALAGGGRACGVRALFKGASGTGKTLAASALAGALGMDLYRVDLATVTSKYVGETEKQLDRLLSAAEALDVALLLDEGDSVLGARTQTQSANDRFANLETNFLLQRLEQFEAVLIVTTNAPENIDGAFQRRMDVVVEFTPPGPEERAAIWRLHLPDHAAPETFIDELAVRCAMTGGQIRNAALHAALLSLDAAAPLAEAGITAAVEREYRKAGQVCPLRRASLARVR